MTGGAFSTSCVETRTNWIMHVERSETRLVYEVQAGEEHGEAELVGDLPEVRRIQGVARLVEDQHPSSGRRRGGERRGGEQQVQDDQFGGLR
jgi:hypothetical protein